MNEEHNKKCELCGATGELVELPCCGHRVCDDVTNEQGVPLEPSECREAHESQTLCHFHYAHDHDGDWQECEECRDSFDTEIYVYYGTNDYNFEVLEDPPDYEPTECAECGTVVDRGHDACQRTQEGILCADCCEIDPRRL